MSDFEEEQHTPTMNTTALGNPQEFFDSLVDRCKERVNVMLPCRIEKYDRVKHLADLRILFNWKMSDGNVMQGCVLKDITIRRLLAGNFIIDFPIAVGDTGWIFASDRDAYDSKKERKPRLPPTPYCNSFASGFWFPDQWGSDKDLDVCGISRDSQEQPVDESGRLVIEHKNGLQKISIGSGDIKVYATDTTVNVTNNSVVNIGNNSTVTVGNDSTVTVGHDASITANNSATVTTPTCTVNSNNLTIQKTGTGDKARVRILGKLYVSEHLYVGKDVLAAFEMGKSYRYGMSMLSHLHAYHIPSNLTSHGKKFSSSPYQFEWKVSGAKIVPNAITYVAATSDTVGSAFNANKVGSPANDVIQEGWDD